MHESNISAVHETSAYPNGSMVSIRAELGVMCGFIGAFILTFIIFVIGFKYFMKMEDRKTEQEMLLIAERMRSAPRVATHSTRRRNVEEVEMKVFGK
jgi:hypothetical protein